MHHARRLLFPTLILGLVALAAFGIRQVIVGQQGGEPGTERQFVAGTDPTREAAAELQRQTVRDFIQSGGDACSLPVGEIERGIPLYPDLPTLINDTDLIVRGRLVARTLEPPQPGTIAGRILSTVEIDEVLSGEAPGPNLIIDAHERVLGGRTLVRQRVTDLDVCTPGQVLLMLIRTERPGEFIVNNQGWARIDGGMVQAAPGNDFLQEHPSAEALLDAVRQIVLAQQQQGLPKGLLFCQFRRTSPRWLDPVVCPGETFNPYQAYRLSTTTRAEVVTGAAEVRLQPGAQLSNLLTSLDVDAQLEPGQLDPIVSDDSISLTVIIEDTVGDGAIAFLYSPSTGIIQIPLSSGQFPAPPVFQELMRPFEAPP